jgi:lysozyme
VDFSQADPPPDRDEALALLRPSPLPRPPVFDLAPDAPTGWLARLAAFFSILIRRA